MAADVIATTAAAGTHGQQQKNAQASGTGDCVEKQAWHKD